MEEVAIKLAILAGKSILKYYHDNNYSVEYKQDCSPVTEADKSSHMIIENGLAKYGLPIMSEEGGLADYSIRKDWTRYWCIDPLDGTKEFIKKNDEFTVNIALIEGGKPTFGVIYVPVKDELYVGGVSYAAEKRAAGRSFLLPNSTARTLKDIKKTALCKVAVSRSHLNERTKEFLSECKLPIKVTMGSSLKFMAIVSKKADIYPRFAPCMEWDSAAAHAILNKLGYSIFNADHSSELVYNKQNLINPHFLCY